MLSINSNMSQKGTRNVTKEAVIAFKIKEIFRERELKMTDSIRQTIFDDNLRIYNRFRRDFLPKLAEL